MHDGPELFTESQGLVAVFLNTRFYFFSFLPAMPEMESRDSGV